MVILLLVIALIASLGLNGFTAWLNYREKRELQIRLASKSLGESEYYVQHFPRQVKQQDKKEKEKIKKEKNMTEEERKIREVAKRF